MDILLAIPVAILLAFIPAFFFAWFIYWLDRYEKEPKFLLFGAFFWGGFIAIVGGIIGSLILDVGFSTIFQNEAIANQASYSVTAPVVEEFWKGLAILIIFLLFRREFDSILDGIVYGAIAGLGFAATENVLYFLSEFSTGGWGGMFTLFVLRVGVFGWGHASYTAFTGIGFALARTNRNMFVKIISPVVGYGLAVFAHSFHNTGATFAGGEGIFLLILAEWFGWFLMLGFIIWMIFHERSLLKKQLGDEVANGFLSQAQYNTAISFFQSSARFKALSSGSLKCTSRFYQVCGKLAHKKEQLAKFGDEKGNIDMIQKLRAEMIQLAPQAKT